MAGVFAPGAGATGLRVGVRLHQESGAPLVPVTRNFRMCFQTGSDGTPVLSLCAEASRAPAARPAAPRPEVPPARPVPSRPPAPKAR